MPVGPASVLAQLLARWPWVEPLLLVIHVASVAVVIGSMVAFDVRLVGFARTQSVKALSRLLLSLALLALLPASASGALLFALHATTLIGSSAFFWKMVVLFALAINAMIFATSPYQQVSTWDVGTPPLAARAAGVISMALLLLVVALGVSVAGSLARAS